MIDISEYEAMAMLDLSADERGRLGAALNSVADGFALLDSVDTDGTEPLVTVLDRCNVMREDVASRLISRDELLACAPEQYEGYFRVPATLD